uniref:C2 domain-containing protein n=1 Tax=Globodera pallida TaxID=36090 RepID=A0A183BY52_GLOPA
MPPLAVFRLACVRKCQFQCRGTRRARDIFAANGKSGHLATEINLAMARHTTVAGVTATAIPGDDMPLMRGQEFNTPLARSNTPTAMPSSAASGNNAMRARSLRRTSAQESVDSAFQLPTNGLSGRARRYDCHAHQIRSDMVVRLEQGQLQPDLYRRRGSIISVGSSGGGASVLGRVQLQLSYDHSTSDMVVRLAQVNLQPPPSSNQCHKLRLLSTTACSSSNNGNISGALNFDAVSGQCNNLPKEPMKLPLSYADLTQAALHVELFAMTAETPAAAVDACAGATCGAESALTRRAACSVPLCALGPSADDLIVWADLERTEETFIRGEPVPLCLQYLPAAERLTLSVHQVQLIGSDRFGRGERLIGQVQFCSAASTSAGGGGGGVTTTASARMSAAARLWRDAVERQWSVPRWVVLEAPTDSGGAGGAILE